MQTNVNKMNLMKVIKAIEGDEFEELGFNMAYWMRKPTMANEDHSHKHGCGTLACIGGWANVVQHGFTNSFAYDENDAMRFLGLTHEEGIMLFYCELEERNEDDAAESLPMSFVTQEEALLVLNHLHDTGEIVWGMVKHDAD